MVYVPPLAGARSGSDRTYKGLKPASVNHQEPLNEPGSDRTYKGLKHWGGGVMSGYRVLVPTVPIRV